MRDFCFLETAITSVGWLQCNLDISLQFQHLILWKSWITEINDRCSFHGVAIHNGILCRFLRFERRNWALSNLLFLSCIFTPQNMEFPPVMKRCQGQKRKPCLCLNRTIAKIRYVSFLLLFKKKKSNARTFDRTQTIELSSLEFAEKRRTRSLVTAMVILGSS